MCKMSLVDIFFFEMFNFKAWKGLTVRLKILQGLGIGADNFIAVLHRFKIPRFNVFYICRIIGVEHQFIRDRD